MWSTKVLPNFKALTYKHSTTTKLNIIRKSSSKLDGRDYDYQYWQNSKIPTFHFQKSLPRLPVPKLEDTCRRYLAAQRPLLNDAAFQKTEQLVNDFQTGIGKQLHEKLLAEDNANKQTSYISKRWSDMYLKDRTPLPINYNPVLVFQQDAKPEYNEQAVRAANLLASSLRFYKSLRDKKLEPEVFHLNARKSDTKAFRTRCAMTPEMLSWYMAYLHNAYPLDMSQYNNLFNSTRIPETGKDRIFSEYARHVVVQCKGHFYVFNVLNENDDVLDPVELYSGIKKILTVAKTEDVNENPLGGFTTMDRDKWADLRAHLVGLSAGNQESLKLIDTALFSICLDDVTIGDDKYKLVRNFLHSDGTNRWFDKSLSLQFSKDGFAAINFEHSWGDGVAVLRIFQDVLKDSTENPQVHPGDLTKDVAIKKLEFNLDTQLKQSVQLAIADYGAVCASLDVNFIESEGLDKKFCKKHRVSPDGIMQLCFQSAYFKQFGKFVATYESCSTAAFKHGRTETIRPCTVATKEFIQAQHAKDSRLSNGALAALIKNCSNVHGQLTKEAAMGQGFDRHLYVLKSLAGDNLPSIFDDPAYRAINHNILSTSTLASPAVLAGGFGPVVRDGYGVGYVIRDHAMGTLATSYPGMNGREFIACLDQSIKEAVSILNAAAEK